MASTAVSTEPNAVITMTCSAGWLGFERLRDRDAVHLGHADVGDRQVERVVRGALQRELATLAGFDAVAFVLKHFGEELARDRVVVDHQQTRRHDRGPPPIVMSMVVPPPSVLSTRTATAVGAGDVLSDRQAEAGAASNLLGREKRLKDVLDVFRRNAFAVVA